jgi:hypothetical protein
MMGRRLSIADKGVKEQRQNFSKRFNEGKCSIILKHCPFCGHHKSLSKPRGLFCSRCKRRLR